MQYYYYARQPKPFKFSTELLMDMKEKRDSFRELFHSFVGVKWGILKLNDVSL